MTNTTPKDANARAEEHRNGLEKVDAIFGGMRNPERKIYANQYEKSFHAGRLDFVTHDLPALLEMAREVVDTEDSDSKYTIEQILEKARKL